MVVYIFGQYYRFKKMVCFANIAVGGYDSHFGGADRGERGRMRKQDGPGTGGRLVKVQHPVSGHAL